MPAPARVLITGATGFTGRHLSRLALVRGAAVFGFARTAAFIPGVVGHTGDIADDAPLAACLAACRPDWIFHLAACVHGSAAATPAEFQRVNVHGTRALLAAARAVVPHARILVAGSSGIYGQPAAPGTPLDESAPLQPASPYAASKAAQDALAADAFRHGLATVRVRIFNQTGPGEPPGLVAGGLARQLARIEAGLAPPVLQTVTLRTARDFCDVRDVAAGCWAALAHGAAGEVYNLCSGASVRIAALVELLLSLSRRRDIVVVESQPAPPPGAIVDQVGNASRLHACSGWSPLVPLAQSLADLLAGCRAALAPPP